MKLGREKSKRQAALDHIRAEVAKSGKVDRYVLRFYIENRISRAVFNQAVDEGYRIWKQLNPELVR